MRIDARYTERRDLPPAMQDVAERRVGFLFAVAYSHPQTSLRALLASAYLQGIEDAASAMEHTAEAHDMKAMG